MFEAGTYNNDEEKQSWKTIMTVDFMSSDESCTEEDQDVLLTKPLLWQSERVAYFKETLDEAALKQKSPLAGRQMKPRRKGMPSFRLKLLVNFLPGCSLRITQIRPIATYC